MNPNQARFRSAWSDLKVAEARIRNRDPAPLLRIRDENAAIALQIQELELRLFARLETDGILVDGDADRQRVEALRTKSLEYLKKLKVDPELWQNLASW